jgi:hypothetical protein
MATHGEIWRPPVGRFSGRLRGGFHGRRQRSPHRLTPFPLTAVSSRATQLQMPDPLRNDEGHLAVAFGVSVGQSAAPLGAVAPCRPR